MALAFTVVDQWYDGKRTTMIGTIVASGSYPTGGDTLNLAQFIKSSLPPTSCTITGISGFQYAYVAATPATGKMKVFVEATVATNTPLAEHTAATYVAGVTGDTITLTLYYKLR